VSAWRSRRRGGHWGCGGVTFGAQITTKFINPPEKQI